MKTPFFTFFINASFMAALSAGLFSACNNPTNADKDLGTHSATDGGSNRMLDTDTARTLEDTASVTTPKQ